MEKDPFSNILWGWETVHNGHRARLEFRQNDFQQNHVNGKSRLGDLFFLILLTIAFVSRGLVQRA